jgi:hypothetical protein
MATSGDDDTYELSEASAAEIPAEWQTVAIYALELPARCPHCSQPVRSLHALRLTRRQVSFTSPLPRSGRVLVCPLCEKIVSAELSGIL